MAGGSWWIRLPGGDTYEIADWSSKLDLATANSTIAAAVAPKVDKAVADVNYAASGLLTTPRVRQPLNAKMVTSFAAGHGWTPANTPGSVTDDTTDYVLGTQSLKVVTKTDNTNAAVDKGGLALDATGKSLRVWLKVENLPNLSSVLLYASDAAFTNFYVWTLIDGNGVAAQQMVRDGEWAVLTVSFAEATVTGAPTRSAIDKLRLRVTGKNNQAVTAHYNGVSLVTEPAAAFPNGVVSITFDDTNASQYTEGQSYLDKYGWGGTFYTICDQVGKAGRMTLAQLQKIANNTPSEIAAHAYTIANHDAQFPNLPLDVLDTELRNVRMWLAANGFKGGDHIAYPNGAWTPDTLAVVNKYFASGRLVTKGIETLRPGNALKLRSWSVTNLTTVAQITAQVDAAYANKGWLIVTFHDLLTTPVNGTEFKIADYRTILDYLATKGIPVLPVGEVLKAMQ